MTKDGYIILAGFALGLILVAYNSFQIHDLNTLVAYERWHTQDDSSLLNARLVKVEAHFTGHKFFAGKDGIGINLVPCDIKEEGCIPDNEGFPLTNLKISHSTFQGWYIGVNSDGVMKTPDSHAISPPMPDNQ